MKQELPKKPSFSRFLAVLISATLTTILFNLLGTPLLRILRNVFGPIKYWVSGFLIAALLFARPETLILGFLLLSCWMTVGIYQEFEERGHGNIWTALLSVSVSSALMILGPQIWAQALGQDLISSIKTSFEELAKQYPGLGDNLAIFGLSVEDVVRLIPAWVIGLQVSSLAFALMLDRKFAVLLGLRYERVASHMRLLEFRLPDFMIWITLLSFLLSFIKISVPWVSIAALNVLVVMLGLYFFQGLAVLEMSFLVMRVGAIFKLLIYLFVVGQLFFLLSAVGLIDYWVDFRQRLKRWKLSEKSQNNEENL